MTIFEYLLIAMIIYTVITFYLLCRVGKLEEKLLEYTSDKTAEYLEEHRKRGTDVH